MMYEVEIIGTGSAVPALEVRNKELAKMVDTSDEWIRERTGIQARRISTRESTTDLALEAAKKALVNAGISASEIEMVIVGTATPDHFFPSTACLVQDLLGAPKATAFDVSAACTGFIFGVSIASQYIRTGAIRTALVIGAETLSRIVDWEDRNTCVLFADGAGAVVLRQGEAGILSGVTGADGSGGAHLACAATPLENRFISSPENSPSKGKITMNGREIFKFAVHIMPQCIQEVLAKANCPLGDVKYIIPHQANTRIVEAAAKRLGIPPGRFYMNIQQYGNTSSASIPLALDEMVREGLLQKGDLVILVGFGGGLTYGAQLIRWTQEGPRQV